MTQALMDKYPDTRDLIQEVVDVSLTQIEAKKQCIFATSALSQKKPAAVFIDAALNEAKKIPDIITRLAIAPLIKAKMYNIDFGPTRIEVAKGIECLCAAKVSNDNDEQLCLTERANGHLSNGHLLLDVLAKKHNIRTPFYAFNGGGGDR